MITEKTCKYIVPQSVIDADYEQYEYYLVWVGSDASIYGWLFEDYTRNKNTDGEIINNSSSNINKVFKESTNRVTLVAEDLSENEFDVLSNIIRSKIVRRYFKDNSYVELAILTDNITKKKSQFNYTLTIEVQEINDNILR
jgi:hypothetical protein